MKFDQLLVYRGSAPMNDYVYQLTDLGRERARRMMEHCTYFGAAPVSLSDYVASVKGQSLENQHPSEQDLKHAFSDILVGDRMLRRLGPAINSGRGLFLFGSAGNGKTTIAERVTRAFGQFVWIPRAIGIDGEIIRLFDPVNHEEAALEQNAGFLDHSRIDRRWVLTPVSIPPQRVQVLDARIERPELHQLRIVRVVRHGPGLHRGESHPPHP
jgi:predicted ATPase with chaperone activity